jgi:hypothetical protein
MFFHVFSLALENKRLCAAFDENKILKYLVKYITRIILVKFFHFKKAKKFSKLKRYEKFFFFLRQK